MYAEKMVRKALSTASDSGLQECLENRLFMMVERSTISRATSYSGQDSGQHCCMTTKLTGKKKACVGNVIEATRIDYQGQVIMRSLLLHWCMLG